MRFSDPQREVSAGSFSVDLVVDEETRGRVIIENQLEATDHDHLGKAITYLTNLEAKAAIWISPKPRPEHVRAVNWLNETTPEDLSFFLVQLAAFRIGQSAPAPLFTPVAGPSPESKGFGQQRKELATRHVLRLKFWEGLLDRAKRLGITTHANRSPGTEAWLNGPSGRAGVTFTYLIRMDDEAGVELYIDTGDQEENKSIFDHLYARRADIEQAFNSSLEWQRLDDKRASRIRHTLRVGGLSAGESSWPDIQDAMIAAMKRLVAAIQPHLRAAGT